MDEGQQFAPYQTTGYSHLVSELLGTQLKKMLLSVALFVIGQLVVIALAEDRGWPMFFANSLFFTVALVPLLVGQGWRRPKTAPASMPSQVTEAFSKRDHEPDQLEDESPADSPTQPEPRVAPPISAATVGPSKSTKAGFKIGGPGLVVALVVVYVVLNNMNVERISGLARSFILEHLKDSKTHWVVADVQVPFTSLMTSGYQISVLLEDADNPAADSKIVRPTIDGNCVFGNCVVSAKAYELSLL